MGNFFKKDKYDGHGITEGVLWQQLIIFLLPIFFGSLFQQLYGVVDAIIVGQYVGKQALGAINSMSQLLKLFQNIFEGVSAGAAIVIGQAWGSRHSRNIEEAVHTGLLLSIIAGICLVCACVPSTPIFLKIMNIPEDMLPYSDIYTRIYFIGLMGSFVYNMGAAIFRATGDTKRPFVYLVICCLTNIVLDIIFVGIMELGVGGAAAATALSQYFSAFLVIRKLTVTEGPHRLILSRLRIKLSVVKEVLRLGLPISAQGVLYSISNMTIYSAINSYGTDVIAAWSIHVKIDTIIWTLMDAFNITGSTFASQNYGAGKYDRVKKGVLDQFILFSATVIVVSLFCYIFASPLARIFIDDGTVIGLAVWVVRFNAPFYLLYLVGCIFSSTIRGCGETFWPMVLTLIGTCFFRVGWIIFWLRNGLPELVYVAACYPVSWAVHSALFTVYYIFGNWKKKFMQNAD